MSVSGEKRSPSASDSAPVTGVPLLDVARGNDPIHEDIMAAIERVCRSGYFVLGPDVRQFEEAVAALCEVRHAVACASGSDALLLALLACDIGPGDEVIVPSFTFFATVSAVTRVGATPVFADIDPATYNLDPDRVAAAVTRNTKAVIPVHLFGQCAAMDELSDLAKRRGLILVEDAAQAIGAKYHDRPAGSIGEMGCFSFYPTKNLGGYGDGGLVTTSDDRLAERLRLLRVHGMQPRYYHQVVGINSRLDSIQAAVLHVKLPHLHRWTEMRRQNAATYDRLFRAAQLDQWIALPNTAPGCFHVWNQYTLRVGGGQRDALRHHLAEANIGTEIYYPLGLHQQQCFKDMGLGDVRLPETEAASREVLHLPIFAGLRDDEQEFVVGRIAEFFAARRRAPHPLAGPNFLKHPAHVPQTQRRAAS